MKTILLTAFGKFGNYPVNSTELVARKLSNSVMSGHRIRSFVFPCEIPHVNRGLTLMWECAQHREIVGIISLGLASDKKGLCIETCAHNLIRSKYCSWIPEGTRVDSLLPYGEELLLDLAPWNLHRFCQRAQANQIPVEFSEEPGGFCCNHLMFQVRSAQIQYGFFSKVPFVYIHTPCSQESVPDMHEFVAQGKTIMSVDTVIQALALLLAD
ncbi:MAG: hypothetical protein WCQ60_00905 [bacterium]